MDGYYGTGFNIPHFAKLLNIKCYHLLTPAVMNSNFNNSQIMLTIDHYLKNVYVKNFKLDSLNIKDIDSLIKKMIPYHFDAIIPGTETGVALADLIAHKLGLNNCNDYHTSNNRLNKEKMQNALKEKGLNYIPFTQVLNLNELIKWKNKNKFEKIILKPSNASGSENLYLCSSELEIEKAYTEFKSYKTFFLKNGGEMLAEKFIEGDEYVVNTFSVSGLHTVSEIIWYHKIKKHNTIIYQDEVLIRKLDSQMNQLINYTFKCLDALDIKFGAAHNELIISKDKKIYLVESGARMMGNCPYLKSFQRAVGHNSFNWLFDSYLKKPNKCKWIKQPYQTKFNWIRIIFWSDYDGKVSKILAYKTLKQFQNIKEINFDLLKFNQMHLKYTKSLIDSPGSCTILDGNLNKLNSTYERVISYLQEPEKYLWELNK